MTTAAPRSRGFHFLAAIVSTGAFLVLVNLLPPPAAANDSQLVAAVPGLVLTLAFVWKRDVWICIIGHFLTDAAGLLSAAAAMGHQR